MNDRDLKRVSVKIFEKYGCVLVRQKGDHLIFHHKNAKRAVVIPKIRNNMKTVGMTREEYFSLLKD